MRRRRVQEQVRLEWREAAAAAVHDVWNWSSWVVNRYRPERPESRPRTAAPPTRGQSQRDKQNQEQKWNVAKAIPRTLGV
jgi:hypothetical protein